MHCAENFNISLFITKDWLFSLLTGGVTFTTFKILSFTILWPVPIWFLSGWCHSFVSDFVRAPLKNLYHYYCHLKLWLDVKPPCCCCYTYQPHSYLRGDLWKPHSSSPNNTSWKQILTFAYVSLVPFDGDDINLTIFILGEGDYPVPLLFFDFVGHKICWSDLNCQKLQIVEDYS